MLARILKAIVKSRGKLQPKQIDWLKANKDNIPDVAKAKIRSAIKEAKSAERLRKKKGLPDPRGEIKNPLDAPNAPKQRGIASTPGKGEQSQYESGSPLFSESKAGYGAASENQSHVKSLVLPVKTLLGTDRGIRNAVAAKTGLKLGKIASKKRAKGSTAKAMRPALIQKGTSIEATAQQKKKFNELYTKAFDQSDALKQKIATKKEGRTALQTIKKARR